MKARAPLAAAAALVALALAGAGLGAWSLGGTGSGAVSAALMPAGSVPGSSVSSHDVTLTWTAARFPGGVAVSGYLVKRYDGVTGLLQTTLSGCTGTVSAVTCTEHSVPTGTWKYTVTPVSGDHWTGAESAQSSLVVVLV